MCTAGILKIGGKSFFVTMFLQVVQNVYIIVVVCQLLKLKLWIVGILIFVCTGKYFLLITIQIWDKNSLFCYYRGLWDFGFRAQYKFCSCTVPHQVWLRRTVLIWNIAICTIWSIFIRPWVVLPSRLSRFCARFFSPSNCCLNFEAIFMFFV